MGRRGMIQYIEFFDAGTAYIYHCTSSAGIRQIWDNEEHTLSGHAFSRFFLFRRPPLQKDRRCRAIVAFCKEPVSIPMLNKGVGRGLTQS